MIKHLQAFWVLKDCGIVLFYENEVLGVDDLLFGGLMSAFSHIIEIEFLDTLRVLRFGNYQLRFHFKDVSNGKHKLIFIGLYLEKYYSFTILRKMREEIYAQEFKRVVELFRDSYSDETIENWDYDVNRFNGFSQNLKPRAEYLADFIEMHWPQNQH